MSLHEDRLFPADPGTRALARALYFRVRDLPIISPHGHTDPRWFAEDSAFPDPTALLITPDHYVFRMLYSQGIPLERLGVGGSGEDPRAAWRLFARHWHLFRGTPTRLWMDHVFHAVFGLPGELTPASADSYYDAIAEALRKPEYRPRALLDRFRIELISTTDSPTDSLAEHEAIQRSPLKGRVIPCFRPDPVLDPEYEGFTREVARLGEVTREDTRGVKGYLRALESRRRRFKELGATATDHGHPTAFTTELAPAELERVFARALAGTASAEEAEHFRGHMLLEMARMSVDDGLVMQLHPGSFRNHNPELFKRFGRNVGADIPTPTEYVRALKPLLDRFGNERRLTLILFTLDESTYARELAPLAGHYPCLRLGPAWWFHDSPEGMRRFRERTTETAGLYNTVGFNDDTRAFLSIPARHDVARRVDCAMLAKWVAEHRMSEEEAADCAVELAYRLPKAAYKL
jgi:glucuronate isomerase